MIPRRYRIPSFVLVWFWLLHAPQAAEVELERVPITHAGVTVSLEMPKRWVNAPFPIRAIPSGAFASSRETYVHAVWRKDLSWKRSWLRAPLGHLVFDALVVRVPKYSRKPDDFPPSDVGFLQPHELLEYLRIGQRRVHEADDLTYSLVKRESQLWVRESRSTQLFHGVPRAESWMIGLTPEIYLRIDIGCTREHDGEAGERWLHSMLSWQNRIIGSLQVTGLRQVLTGHERVTPWAFPSVLKTPVELPE